MKKLLPLFGAALFMVACNQTPEQVAGTSTSPFIQQQAQAQQPVADTAGLASFNAWKAQNELADMNQYQAKQAPAAAPVRKAAVKSSAPARKSSSRPSAPSTTSNEGSGSGTETAGTGTGTGAEETAKKKEGWSKAAKGAVIGGVAGAAGGAVINKKNRVVGAVVGAVIGAGGGYVIGRKMDKKDGRIDYNLN